MGKRNREKVTPRKLSKLTRKYRGAKFAITLGGSRIYRIEIDPER